MINVPVTRTVDPRAREELQCTKFITIASDCGIGHCSARAELKCTVTVIP